MIRKQQMVTWKKSEAVFGVQRSMFTGDSFVQNRREMRPQFRNFGEASVLWVPHNEE